MGAFQAPITEGDAGVGVEVRLLGSVEVLTNGQPVPAGESRRRAVLAVLASSAGSVVTLETMVRRIWGEDPPRRAFETLRSHITRLRRVLEAASAGGERPVRIVSHSGAYRLDIDPDEVDLHRFRRLVAAAREPGGTPEHQVIPLREAVGLWRGEPLTGIRGEWAARTGEAWRRERLHAMAAWAHAEVNVGNPEVVLAPLTELAAEHPEVEPLTIEVMRALVAVARPTDALMVAERHRRSLAEAYGTDQSPRLREVYEAILRGEERPTSPRDADGEAPAVTSSATPVPAQLPPDVPNFAGRAEQLSELDALLAAAEEGGSTAVVIATLSGTAGVGKTTLALRWARRVADRFPDGQLYVNLRGFDADQRVMTPAEAVRGLLDSLGAHPDRIPRSPDAQIALYRSLMAGRRTLLVLDNARDASQVRPLLPGSPTAFVVVTSRDQLTGLAADGAHPIALGLLSQAEARQMLAERLGADRVAAEPGAAEKIVEACARLPLALSVVAARARQTGFQLSDVAAELTTPGGRLDALDGGDQASQVRAIFSWSYRTLTPAAARLFRLIGQHPGPHISRAAAASLAGSPVAAVRASLAELTRANLLTERLPGRYVVHDLLREYATELAVPGERHEASHRLLDHYARSAHAADRLVNPHRDPMPLPLGPAVAGARAERSPDQHLATSWLATERPALVAAVRHALDRGFDTLAWQLVWAIDTFLDRRGHWHELRACWLLALRAAERLGDPAARGYAHRLLAWVSLRLGHGEEADAHLDRALVLAVEARDQVGQGYVHANRARSWRRRGDLDQALRNAERAVELFRAAGNARGEATATNAVGWYLTLLGDHKRALVHCERALILLRAVGDRFGEGGALDSVGFAHHHLGDHAKAIKHYQRAIECFRETGNRYFEADTLTHLGDAYRAVDAMPAAAVAWRDAFELLTALGHPDARNVETRLGEVAK